MDLSFEECMNLSPIENPISDCFECGASMCEICKKPNYYYKRGTSPNFGWLTEEENVNRWRNLILEEILEEEQTNDFLNNIQ